MDPLQMAELELLEEVVGVENAEEKFKIKDLDGLNWAMRKINALEQQQAEIDALAQKEFERIKSWQQGERNKFDHSKNFFEGLIVRYALEQREEKGKSFKTIKTPYGSVGFRKQQPKWEINDEAAIAHLKSAGLDNLVRVKEEIDKTALKKVLKVNGINAVDENGEIVPGILIYEQEDKLNIKAGD